MAELCTECLKKYGEEVSKVHPPVSSDKIQCCGDPSDCADYISGNCSGSVDKS